MEFLNRFTYLGSTLSFEVKVGNRATGCIRDANPLGEAKSHRLLSPDADQTLIPGADRGTTQIVVSPYRHVISGQISQAPLLSQDNGGLHNARTNSFLQYNRNENARTWRTDTRWPDSLPMTFTVGPQGMHEARLLRDK